ncbi:MAG: helix-turn-helix transcriptional regulator [Actinomycetales bacterium]
MSSTGNRRVDPARWRARLVELCSAALDSAELRRDTDALLRQTVDYAVAAWATVDPSSLLFTSCIVTGMEETPGYHRYVFDNEWLHDDVNKYSQLASAEPGGTVAVLSEATGGQPMRSRRFRELLAAAGAGDELRAALPAGGACWGTLTLYRAADQGFFSAAESSLVASLAPILGEGLRLSLLRRAAEAPQPTSAGPGVLMVGPSGEPETTTERARELLARAADPGQLPAALHALDAASRAPAAGTGLTRSRIPTVDGGWLVLHAARAGDRTAVVVERARPPELADVIVQAYGFTARERQVLALVLQGLSNKRIALRLGISAYTVADHLRAAFAKAGVTSRGELAALLNDSHYQPVAKAGGVPGPYGWFLQ